MPVSATNIPQSDSDRSRYASEDDEGIGGDDEKPSLDASVSGSATLLSFDSSPSWSLLGSTSSLCRFPATAASLSATHSLDRFSLAGVELTDDEADNNTSLHVGDDGFVAAAAVDDLSFCARE